MKHPSHTSVVFASRVFCLTLLILFQIRCPAQGQSDQETFTLQEIITLAQQRSLESLRARNEYLAAYWQYRNHRTDRLPTLNLSTSPVTYNRSVDVIYSVLDSTNVITERQILDSDFNVSIDQNIFKTGGRLFVATRLGRTETILPEAGQQYANTPIRFGIDQPLFGFNRFKWDKRIEPLRYDIAQKQYIRSGLDIAITVTGLYFDLLVAERRIKVARMTISNSDTLLILAKKRQEIAAMEAIDVLSIELDLATQRTSLMEAENEYDRARTRLYSYLVADPDTQLNLEVPQNIPVLQIDEKDAIEKARLLSPEFAELKAQILEAERDLDQAGRENFEASINASFGVNNAERTLAQTYSDLNQQQQVNVRLDIPIVDWGRRKGRKRLSQQRLEATNANLRSSQNDMELDLIMTIRQFNMQPRLLQSARAAEELAIRTSELTHKRFKLGRGDITGLSQQVSRLEDAAINYVESLRQFWTLYYTVKRETLYDFESHGPISEDFELLNGTQ